jgi:large subunit ribosomal protein L23
MKLDAHDIVRRPLITEKGTDLTTGTNAYTFLVAPYANKVQIRRAVEELVRRQGARRAHDDAPRKIKGRGKAKVRRPDWKRAVVSLAEGQSVEFL